MNPLELLHAWLEAERKKHFEAGARAVYERWKAVGRPDLGATLKRPVEGGYGGSLHELSFEEFVELHLPKNTP